MLSTIGCWIWDWNAIAAVATAVATITAIYIATTDARTRRAERENAKEIYKILVGTELQAFSIIIPELKKQLEVEMRGGSVLWRNIVSMDFYSPLLAGTPLMDKHVELLRLMPLQDGKNYAMISMLASDISHKLIQSKHREKFMETPVTVIRRLDILARYLSKDVRLTYTSTDGVQRVVESLKGRSL